MESKNRIINKKTINIITILLYLMSMLIFELLYCNSANIINLFQGQEITYNFSLCRVVMYILFFVLYFIFKNKFIEEALKVSENKYKRVFIYLSIIATILALIFTLAFAIWKPLYTRAISIALITVILGTVFIIYVSNNLIKNITVVVFTIGLVFSISKSNLL